ncbi:hypothetical protein PR048_030381 [Dryococelus australis]|uniref:Uncharacterized protein n=1 Tax=Dryococelus australis TaxID=614101 RepID=A0ABQ9G8U3_9NEOP|nr:hypothetical protein PR048_030381 [Dryococelus australis]
MARSEADVRFQGRNLHVPTCSAHIAIICFNAINGCAFFETRLFLAASLTGGGSGRSADQRHLPVRFPTCEDPERSGLGLNPDRLEGGGASRLTAQPPCPSPINRKWSISVHNERMCSLQSRECSDTRCNNLTVDGWPATGILRRNLNCFTGGNKRKSGSSWVLGSVRGVNRVFGERRGCGLILLCWSCLRANKTFRCSLGKLTAGGSFYDRTQTANKCASSPTNAQPGSIPHGTSPPDFRTWESYRSMPLVSGFSRRSPVSIRACIPALLRYQLASPSSALKTSMSRAGQNFPLRLLPPPPQDILRLGIAASTCYTSMEFRVCVQTPPQQSSFADLEGRKGSTVKRINCVIAIKRKALNFTSVPQGGHSGVKVRLLAPYLSEQSWIPGGATPCYSHVGIVPYDAAGRQFGSALVDDRPIMNAVVSGVVWTNGTMVSSNTDINRTGVLAVADIGDTLLIRLKCHRRRLSVESEGDERRAELHLDGFISVLGPQTDSVQCVAKYYIVSGGDIVPNTVSPGGELRWRVIDGYKLSHWNYADFWWRSRLVNYRSWVREVLGSNPKQRMGHELFLTIVGVVAFVELKLDRLVDKSPVQKKRTESLPRRRHRGANPQHSDYKSATLPLNYGGRTPLTYNSHLEIWRRKIRVESALFVPVTRSQREYGDFPYFVFTDLTPFFVITICLSVYTLYISVKHSLNIRTFLTVYGSPGVTPPGFEPDSPRLRGETPNRYAVMAPMLQDDYKVKAHFYGPFMFQEATVAGNRYLDTLQLFFSCLDYSKMVALKPSRFNKVGHRHIFANAVRDPLNQNHSREMDRPRITTHSLVYRTRVRDLADLKDRSRPAIDTITPHMLAKVFRSSSRRWQLCFGMAEGHVEGFQKCSFYREPPIKVCDSACCSGYWQSADSEATAGRRQVAPERVPHSSRSHLRWSHNHQSQCVYRPSVRWSCQPLTFVTLTCFRTEGSMDDWLLRVAFKHGGNRWSGNSLSSPRLSSEADFFPNFFQLRMRRPIVYETKRKLVFTAVKGGESTNLRKVKYRRRVLFAERRRRPAVTSRRATVLEYARGRLVPGSQRTTMKHYSRALGGGNQTSLVPPPLHPEVPDAISELIPITHRPKMMAPPACCNGFHWHALQERHRARWRSGNSLDTHSGGPGFDSMVFRNHSRRMLGWVANKGHGRFHPNPSPIPLPCATCTVSNDLAVDETLSSLTLPTYQNAIAATGVQFSHSAA